MHIHIIHICKLISDSVDKSVDYTLSISYCVYVVLHASPTKYSMAEVCHCDSLRS